MSDARRLKVCIVSSCGGHLSEVRCLRPAYEPHDCFYVLNDQAILPEDMQGRTYFISHAERNWLVLWNFWESYRLLRTHRPDVILSTGAGPAVPFAIVGRYLFGTRVVFLETITRISKPSMTGRLMYWLSHDFYYQWQELGGHFPRGKCVGPLI